MSDQILRTFRNEDFKRLYLKPITDDSDLSWKAKGIHTYLITRPDGWEFNRQDIINRSKDGRAAVKSGLEELKEQGYLEIENFQKDDGKWASIWKVAENPEMLGNQSVAGNPTTGNPTTDNQPHSSLEDSSRKHESANQESGKKEKSSTQYMLSPYQEAKASNEESMLIFLNLFRQTVDGKHGNVERSTYLDAKAELSKQYTEWGEEEFIRRLREFFNDDSRSGLPKLAYFSTVSDRFFK